jgi:glycosyltransferase involved in cell wall biosynthesis
LPVKFSLILATVGRVRELERFLASLAIQTYRDFELIVIDQNQDDRLVPLLKNYENHFQVKHLRSAPGLSRARNAGLRHITGDIVGFPDDDCWYPQRLLDGIEKFLKGDTHWDILTVAPLNEKGAFFLGRGSLHRGYLTQSSVWKSAISWTLFIKRHVAEAVGPFDEKLGIGSGTRWQSGEETDFLVRAMKMGFSMWSEPDLAVYHEAAYIRFGLPDARKTYRYALGMGHVLKKNGYPIVPTSYFILKPLAGALLMLAAARPREALRYCCMFSGRLLGYASSPS